MKKVIYTILSILSIVYIAFLAVDVIKDSPKVDWIPNMGWFEKWFDVIVRFGGVAIIFCFALVNFTGNPLKMVFFLLLIVAIVLYIVVLVVPDFFFNLFAPKGDNGEAEMILNTIKMLL